MRPTHRVHTRIVAGLIATLAGLCLSTVASADNRHGDAKRYSQHVDRYDHRSHGKHHSQAKRPAHRDYYARDHHHKPKHKHDRHHRAGWHYHSGRYWAPASYRGRYCTDLHHFHRAHYHVAYDDYYEYYYPRYRYYGPHTHGASLIITVPLF